MKPGWIPGDHWNQVKIIKRLTLVKCNLNPGIAQRSILISR